jgi:hypothetical protein
MNEPSDRMSRYVWGGAAVLCLLMILAWFAIRQESPLPAQQSAKVQPRKPVAPAFEPDDDFPSDKASTNQATAGHADNPTSTNAAAIYRQAFDLFNQLSQEQKDILRNWPTNVDASAEAELCELVRPICDLMHQATAVTNCDWGIDNPITFDTKLPHLAASRNIARAAIWNAAHCRADDVAGATDDAVSVLQLGQQISHSALIGYLVDVGLHHLTSEYVSQNLDLFQGTDAQRLAAALGDPAYQDAPSDMINLEADMVERWAAKLAALPPDKVQDELVKTSDPSAGPLPTIDQAAALATLAKVVDSHRELAGLLQSSTEDEYETWQQHSTDLQTSSPLAKMFLEVLGNVVDKVRGAEVEQQMVLAGLAVAQNGPAALATVPDPASGQAFVYTKTVDGFDLQSAYTVKGRLYTIHFK